MNSESHIPTKELASQEESNLGALEYTEKTNTLHEAIGRVKAINPEKATVYARALEHIQEDDVEKKILLVHGLCTDLDAEYSKIDTYTKKDMTEVLGVNWFDHENNIENRTAVCKILKNYSEEMTRAVGASVFPEGPQTTGLDKATVLKLFKLKIDAEQAELEASVLEENLKDIAEKKRLHDELNASFLEYSKSSIEIDPQASFEITYPQEGELVLVPVNEPADTLCKVGGGENGAMNLLRELIQAMNNAGEIVGGENQNKIVYSLDDIAKEAYHRLTVLGRRAIQLNDEYVSSVQKAQEKAVELRTLFDREKSLVHSE